MKSNKVFRLPAFAVAAILIGTYGPSTLAVNDEPLTDNWAPSEWGPDDKAGAANRRNAASVLNAMTLVKQGKVATLGKVYQQDAPGFGTRGWRMTIPGLPTGGPFGGQELVYNDEYLSTEIGQFGTQFDGPGHIGVITSKGMYFYNGRYLKDADITSYGVGPLGVEHVGALGYVCRGVLLDAAALRGVEQVPIPVENSAADPGVITDADVREMVKRQGISTISEGDCVFLYTVHGNIWHPSKWGHLRRGGEVQTYRAIQLRRAGLWHLSLRVPCGAQGCAHWRRHLGGGRGGTGFWWRGCAALRVSHQTAD